jgi:alpha-tubulin suppressor-like RCC1 family protein
MKKLLIISILLCTLIAALTSCSEKTSSENKIRLSEESITTSAVTTSAAKQATENTTLQTTSVSVLSENVTTSTADPVTVSDLQNIDRLSLGGSHTGFVKEDGSLYVWGCGFEYQLGNGEHCIAESPIKIMDDVENICFGFENSAAVTKNGSLYIWEKHKPNPAEAKELFINPPFPEKIMDDVKSVSLGIYHTAVIKNDNTLYMWGQNDFGQVGNGKSGEYEIQTEPVKIMDNVQYVGLGAKHSAAITEDESLYMWGANDSGQLGNGEEGYKDFSAVPIKIMDNVKAVSLGNGHSGALTKDGELYMWGNNRLSGVGKIETDNGLVSVPTKINIIDNS